MLTADRELNCFFNVRKLLNELSASIDETRISLFHLLIDPLFEVPTKDVKNYAVIKNALITASSKIRLMTQTALAFRIIELDNLAPNRLQLLKAIEQMLQAGEIVLSLSTSLKILRNLDDLSFKAFIRILEISGVKRFQLLSDLSNYPKERLDILGNAIATYITDFCFDLTPLSVQQMSEFVCSVIERAHFSSLQLKGAFFSEYCPRLSVAIVKSGTLYLGITNFQLFPDRRSELHPEFYASVLHLHKLTLSEYPIYDLTIKGWQLFLAAMQQSQLLSLSFAPCGYSIFRTKSLQSLLKNKPFRDAFCFMLINSPITKLDFGDQLDSEDGVEVLQDILAATAKSKVQSLGLSRSLLETRDMAIRELLYKFIASNHTLRKLSFSKYSPGYVEPINGEELIAALNQSKIIKLKVTNYPLHKQEDWDNRANLRHQTTIRSLSLPYSAAEHPKVDNQWCPFFEVIAELNITSLNLAFSNIPKAHKGWALLCDLVKKGKLLKLTLSDHDPVAKSKINALKTAIKENFLIQLRGSIFEYNEFQDLKYRNQWVKQTFDRVNTMICLLVTPGTEIHIINSIDKCLDDLIKAISLLQLSDSNQAKTLCLQTKNYMNELLWKKGRCFFDKSDRTTEDITNATEAWLSISETSSCFEFARLEIFQFVYVNFFNIKSYPSAFMKAAKHLIKDDKTFVSFNEENQRILDHFIWRAAGGVADLTHTAFSPMLRMCLLRYIQLLALIESSKKRLVNPKEFSDVAKWQILIQYLEKTLQGFDVNKLSLLQDLEFEQKCQEQLQVVQTAWLESQIILKDLKLSVDKIRMIAALHIMKTRLDVDATQQVPVITKAPKFNIKTRISVRRQQAESSRFLKRKMSNPEQKIDLEKDDTNSVTEPKNMR